MEIALLILLLSLVPAIASWWQMRQFERRMQRRLESIAQQSSSTLSSHYGLRRVFDLANAPAEFRYIDGVGYVIGDLSCQFNARSPHMRCAVNPFGPCKNCTAYETKAN